MLLVTHRTVSSQLLPSSASPVVGGYFRVSIPLLIKEWELILSVANTQKSLGWLSNALLHSLGHVEVNRECLCECCVQCNVIPSRWARLHLGECALVHLKHTTQNSGSQRDRHGCTDPIVSCNDIYTVYKPGTCQLLKWWKSVPFPIAFCA